MPPGAETIPPNNQTPEAKRHCARCPDSVVPLNETDRLPRMMGAGVELTLRHPVGFGCAVAIIPDEPNVREE